MLVRDGIKAKIMAANFIAVSCDEVTIVDHDNYVQKTTICTVAKEHV
jgi:hypothetical protein